MVYIVNRDFAIAQQVQPATGTQRAPHPTGQQGARFRRRHGRRRRCHAHEGQHYHPGHHARRAAPGELSLDCVVSRPILKENRHRVVDPRLRAESRVNGREKEKVVLAFIHDDGE